jgi:hypothetical protein
VILDECFSVRLRLAITIPAAIDDGSERLFEFDGMSNPSNLSRRIDDECGGNSASIAGFEPMFRHPAALPAGTPGKQFLDSDPIADLIPHLRDKRTDGLCVWFHYRHTDEVRLTVFVLQFRKMRHVRLAWPAPGRQNSKT